VFAVMGRLLCSQSLPSLLPQTDQTRVTFVGTFRFFIHLTIDVSPILLSLLGLATIVAATAAVASIHDQAQLLMRSCQHELSRHNTGIIHNNNSSLPLSSNAAVLLSAAAQQMQDVNHHDNSSGTLSPPIAMNMEQIQRWMNSTTTSTTNVNATAARPPDRPETQVSRIHGTLQQQRQWMFSPRVSQYAHLQQRQHDAVAAATTMATLRREQEHTRAATVAAIVAVQNKHQEQNRMDQLQRDLQTLQQMNSLPSASSASALSLAPNPMHGGTNLAWMIQHQQQQELSLQMMMMIRMQPSQMPTSSSSSSSSSAWFHPHAPVVGRTFHAMQHSNDDSVPHAIIPLSLPISLARLAVDEYKLSEHQNFLRQQIEAFPATEEDVMTHTRGRNKPILLGQVGIRCRHCAHLPVSRRQKGSTYFPSNKLGIYQAAQNMSTAHIQCGLCTEMPEAIKLKFIEIMSAKNPSCSSGAGRPYWAQSATQLGLVDTEEGIRFIRNLPPGIMILE
jgi:hypothetical protein